MDHVILGLVLLGCSTFPPTPERLAHEVTLRPASTLSFPSSHRTTTYSPMRAHEPTMTTDMPTCIIAMYHWDLQAWTMRRRHPGSWPPVLYTVQEKQKSWLYVGRITVLFCDPSTRSFISNHALARFVRHGRFLLSRECWLVEPCRAA